MVLPTLSDNPISTEHLPDYIHNILICPVTYQLFSDPVIATDGHTYERAWITQWLQMYTTSLMTKCELNVNQLVPTITI